MPVLVIAIAISLISVGQAYASVDMFLKIDGVPGESQDNVHKDEIDVMSWSWGAVDETGKVSVNSISIDKFVDKATPKLMEGVLTGKHFTQATLTIRKSGEKPLEFVKYTFKDVIITSSITGGKADDNKQSESITLNFARFETFYTPVDDKGEPLPVVTFCWDFKLNMACTATTDTDGDGFASDVDCDDTNPAIHPGATEIQDAKDNDCDGEIDEGFGASDQVHQDTLKEVRNIEEKLDGGRDSLITQISDKLNSIANDISSLLVSTGQVLGILQDPNFGLHEIKNEVKNIETQVSDVSTKVDQMASEAGAFTDTETISLNGKLKNGDFKLLMDITPFKSTTGHVAMKVPCNKNSKTPLAIVTGVAPNVSPISMTPIAPLSSPGKSCLYHGDLSAGITDIALLNTGNPTLPEGEDKDKKTVNFGNNEEYSVTITIKGR